MGSFKKKFILSLLILAMAVSVFAGDKAKSSDKVIWTVKTAAAKGVLWYSLIVREEEGKPARGIIRQWHEGKDSEGLSVEISYMHVDGKYAWFAGKCIEDKGIGMNGRWLFIAVNDGGEPGKLVDHLWCEWLADTKDAEAIAKRKVESLEKPCENIMIKDGNIVINNYSKIKPVP